MHQKEVVTGLEKKVEAFWQSDVGTRPKNFYNTYDYAAFWKGRDFEDDADRIAIRRLMKKIPPPHRKIVDVGGGIGRIASLYEEIWDRAVILDPSHTQLAIARKNVARPDKIEFLEGFAESIPLPAASCDAALCIRTFHYVEDPRHAIKEIGRVLMHGGHLVLEIPNKIHMKARIRGFFSQSKIHSYESVSRSIEDKETLFLNHHPAAIRDILLTEWFEIVDTLSVSNFRSPFLKKLFPVSLLLFFEKILQRPLAASWFGPSIYFLARKKIAKE
jgi:ubiquinone/menaquinone biosynthesis C-methylase UbiE